MKTTRLIAVALLSLTVASHSAVNIGYVANSTVGGFVSSSGGAISAGGVSVGFFSLDPSASFWTGLSDTPSTAWSAILAAGYTDVRQFGSFTGTLDWEFPLTMGGTVTGISFTTLPQNTRLYVIGFNGGTFNLSTPANSWTGASEWGAVSAFGHATNSQNFLSPADLGTKALNFSPTSVQLTSSDVLKGSLATASTVAMVPEPSTYALLSLAGLALGGYAMRRRRRA